MHQIRSLAGRIRVSAADFGMRLRPVGPADLTFSDVLALEPNRGYAYAHYYFWRRLPKELREHRAYFRQAHRGFGEDAFHAMWWLLFQEKRPRKVLEVGVYRGQTLSLWAIIARRLELDAEIHGLSPLSDSGDDVSSYADLDYEADIRINFSRFDMRPPALTRAYSTEAAGLDLLTRGGPWDVIYIDGSHDRDVVLSDYRSAREGLAPGGIVVFDDAALSLPFRPPANATAGHPGPSSVVDAVVRREMRLLGSIGHNVLFTEA